MRKEGSKKRKILTISKKTVGDFRISIYLEITIHNNKLYVLTSQWPSEF